MFKCIIGGNTLIYTQQNNFNLAGLKALPDFYKVRDAFCAS